MQIIRAIMDLNKRPRTSSRWPKTVSFFSSSIGCAASLWPVAILVLSLRFLALYLETINFFGLGIVYFPGQRRF